jgi:hypothetical protein
MKQIACLLVVFLALPLVAQDPVTDAKAGQEKKHHEALVAKAEQLLQQKQDLEKQLADVNAKLSKLANGEDVKLSSGTYVWITPTPSITYIPISVWECSCTVR